MQHLLKVSSTIVVFSSQLLCLVHWNILFAQLELFIITHTTGQLLTEDVWTDLPFINVLVQVRDEIGGVQCEETSILIKAIPEPKLKVLLSIEPQVRNYFRLCISYIE